MWEDQRELQGNISYNALCTGQDIAWESGFHIQSFDPNHVVGTGDTSTKISIPILEVLDT